MSVKKKNPNPGAVIAEPTSVHTLDESWADVELPDGWRAAVLRSVCEQTDQWNPERQPRDEFWYLDVSSVCREHFSVREPQRLATKQAPSRARKIVRKGDAIFATVRPTLRRVAFITPDHDGEIASTAFCVVRADRERAVPRFLYYLLLSDELNEEVAKFQGGVSYPAVNDKDVLNRSVPMPPKPEQEKIAAVLWRVQQTVEVEGKLVRAARELKAATLRHLFTHGLCDDEERDTPYGTVPAAWDERPLGACCHVQSGATKGRKIAPEDAIEAPYLRVANVQDGHLDLSEMKTITIRRDELDGYRLQDGDVVLTEGGDFDKLGRGFIWRGEVPNCIHQNHVFAVRANREVIVPEYLAYLAQSPYGRQYFLTVAHKTTNLACINATKLKAFPLVFPRDLDEQREIARQLAVVDAKIGLHERRREILRGLFRTLLRDLLTARRRVHELDIDVSEVTAA